MKKGIFWYLTLFFEMGMVIFFIAGLVLLFGTFKYAETTGIVTSIGNEKTYLNFRNDYLVIDYNVRGKDYTYYRSTNLINRKTVGDKYKILYNRDNPSVTRYDYHIILFFELGLFSLIMALFMNYFRKKTY